MRPVRLRCAANQRRRVAAGPVKPYIVRPNGLIRERSHDNSVGVLQRRLDALWRARCAHCRFDAADRLRADAAEALWRHYLDEHKEQ